MAQFAAHTPATFTPTANTTTLNSWVLTTLTAGMLAKVKMFDWGGDGTSLVGYITRWARVSNTPATPTALTTVPSSPNAVALASVNTYTTVATGTADANLYKQNWNVQGGGGTIVLPIGGEWFVVGGALGTAYNQIGCGNVTGADANLSSYGLQWEE
jgi:hypothetical protein